MYMPYTQNPYLPKVRREAVDLVVAGWSMRQTARHFGVEPSTIMRWVRRGTLYRGPIATASARPHHHPSALAPEVVRAISGGVATVPTKRDTLVLNEKTKLFATLLNTAAAGVPTIG